MRLSKFATRFAVVTSLPFVALASLCELVGTLSSDLMVKDDMYTYGDAIYFYLGYPLPRLLLIFVGHGGLRDADSWWAVPLLDALLIIQWVVWAQLVVLINRMLKYLWPSITGRKSAALR